MKDDIIYVACPSCGALGELGKECEFCGTTIVQPHGDSDIYSVSTGRIIDHRTISYEEFTKKVGEYSPPGGFCWHNGLAFSPIRGIINLNGDTIVPNNRYADFKYDQAFWVLRDYDGLYHILDERATIIVKDCQDYKVLSPTEFVVCGSSRHLLFYDICVGRDPIFTTEGTMDDFHFRSLCGIAPNSFGLMKLGLVNYCDTLYKSDGSVYMSKVYMYECNDNWYYIKKDNINELRDMNGNLIFTCPIIIRGYYSIHKDGVFYNNYPSSVLLISLADLISEYKANGTMTINKRGIIVPMKSGSFGCLSVLLCVLGFYPLWKLTEALFS